MSEWIDSIFQFPFTGFYAEKTVQFRWIPLKSIETPTDCASHIFNSSILHISVSLNPDGRKICLNYYIILSITFIQLWSKTCCIFIWTMCSTHRHTLVTQLTLEINIHFCATEVLRNTAFDEWWFILLWWTFYLFSQVKKRDRKRNSARVKYKN